MLLEALKALDQEARLPHFMLSSASATGSISTLAVTSSRFPRSPAWRRCQHPIPALAPGSDLDASNGRQYYSAYRYLVHTCELVAANSVARGSPEVGNSALAYTKE